MSTMHLYIIAAVIFGWLAMPMIWSWIQSLLGRFSGSAAGI